MKLTDLFSTQEHNVVMTALEECAKDAQRGVYHYMDTISLTCLVTEVVDKIYELGFQITPKP